MLNGVPPGQAAPGSRQAGTGRRSFQPGRWAPIRASIEARIEGADSVAFSPRLPQVVHSGWWKVSGLEMLDQRLSLAVC
jgi:hypothetical protein